MVTITKAEMLARIVASGEIPFRITFVKATGKDAGRLTEKVCYYGAPNPEAIAQSSRADTATRKPRKSYLESNSIPLTEFGQPKLITPHISHIVEYNGKQVIH